MPLIRDTTDSENVNRLSYPAEVLFYRIMMKADCFGRFYASPVLIKNQCYPVKETVRTSDIERWLSELSAPLIGNDTSNKATGLIRMYAHNGKPFLEIVNFGQKLKWQKPKYPPPPEVEGEEEIEVEDEGEVIFREEISSSIKSFFGFNSEMLYVSKWADINSFIKKLGAENKLEIFKVQFEFYKNYKAKSQEKIHSFPSFINGGWAQENWEQKLNDLIKKESQNGTFKKTGFVTTPKFTNEGIVNDILKRA